LNDVWLYRMFYILIETADILDIYFIKVPYLMFYILIEK